MLFFIRIVLRNTKLYNFYVNTTGTVSPHSVYEGVLVVWILGDIIIQIKMCSLNDPGYEWDPTIFKPLIALRTLNEGLRLDNFL